MKFQPQGVDVVLPYLVFGIVNRLQFFYRLQLLWLIALDVASHCGASSLLLFGVRQTVAVAGTENHIAARSVSLRATDTSLSATVKTSAWVRNRSATG